MTGLTTRKATARASPRVSRLSAEHVDLLDDGGGAVNFMNILRGRERKRGRCVAPVNPSLAAERAPTRGRRADHRRSQKSSPLRR
jgi:hypothetical protein